jgi:hypothetical protein
MAPLKIPAERVDTLAISRDEWLLATPGTDESSKPKKDTHILLWQIQRR